MSGRLLFYLCELIWSIFDINLQANVFNLFYVSSTRAEENTGNIFLGLIYCIFDVSIGIIYVS